MPAPTVPDIAQGNEVFSTMMRAFHQWEATELYNAVNDFINSRLLPTNTVSTTSNSITAGNKTFTVETGKGFLPGQFIIAANTAAPANYIQGQVITYNSATGALVMSNIVMGGTGTFTAWTITQGVTGGGATLGSNSYTGNQLLASGAAFKESLSTVASALTPDIWTNQSNNINYTGTVTATGFANAPQAGVNCSLFCAAACAFTASANMLIDGYVSGQTFTASAGDRIHVFALSTTQFRLEIAKANGQTANVCPIFRANAAANQSITTSVATKVNFGTESIDTNNNFATSRFTPTVAGWYSLKAILRGTGTNVTSFAGYFYLNGAEYSRGFLMNIPANSNPQMQSMSDEVYLNGTTDYIEVYAMIIGTTPSLDFAAATNSSIFSGALLRAA